MRKLVALLMILSMLPMPSFADSPSGLLNTNRYIDWSSAGAGVIPNRTSICQTLGVAGQTSSYAQSVTNTQIESALSSCSGSNGVVYLNPGTYTMSASIVSTASNVTLRGAKPANTIIKWTGMDNNCLGIYLNGFCVTPGNSGVLQYANNTCTVTAGVAQGSTSITLGTTIPTSIDSGAPSCTPSALQAGSIIQVTQQDDGTTDTGNYWDHSNKPVAPTGWTNWGGASNGWVPGFTNSANPGRMLTHTATVTSVVGSTVNFSPAFYAPKWSQTQNPYVSFAPVLPVTGFGIEDLTMDTSPMGDNEAILGFVYTTKSWVKDVAFLAANVNYPNGGTSRKHILAAASTHLTIRDSYLFGSAGSSDGYGIDLAWGTFDSLVENNICHHISTCLITENASGNVFGYNYATDNYFNNGDPGWQQCDVFHHDGGDTYNLVEGHVGICSVEDDFHSPSFALTTFRSYFSGHDAATTCPLGATCGTIAKNQEVVALMRMAYNRYPNDVANVLGTAGVETIYANKAASANGGAGIMTNCPAASWGTVLSFGYANQNQLAFTSQSGNNCYYYNDPPNVYPFDLDNDPLTFSTAVLWGNWDNVNNAVRTDAGETACSASTYPGLCSPSTVWGSYRSFYLTATPAWWNFPSGTSSPWPGIGPDVTAGNIAGTAGHANLNPAANNYLNVLHGLTDGSTGPLPFDGTVYYSGTPTAATPTFSPASGAPPQTVTISDSTPSSTIYYTTNGTTPTTASTVYTAPISVSVNPTTVQAIATAAGYSQSAVGSATYSGSTAATPTFSPSGGTQPSGTVVTISTTPACTSYIYWALTTPPDTGSIHGSSFSLLASDTWYAKVIGCPSYADSAVGSATFTVPAATNGSSFSAGSAVSLGVSIQ